jgi:hypothetical protein
MLKFLYGYNIIYNYRLPVDVTILELYIDINAYIFTFYV